MSNTQTFLTVDEYEIEVQKLKKLLETEKGRSAAAARAQTYAERDAKVAKIEAETYKAEVDAVLAQSCDQLAQACAVVQGIRAFAFWAVRETRAIVLSEHLLHRAGTMLKVLKDLLQAAKNPNNSTSSLAINNAEAILKTVDLNHNYNQKEYWDLVRLQVAEISEEKIAQVNAILFPDRPNV